MRNYILPIVCFFIFLYTASLFSEEPEIEIINPECPEHIDFGPIEYVDDSHYVYVRKWDSYDCTSDIFQPIIISIEDQDGIDWASLRIEVVAFGGSIIYGEGWGVWWLSTPFTDSTSLSELYFGSQQDYNIIIDTSSDSTTGLITINPIGRGHRPYFICSDYCYDLFPYFYSCCLNVGDIYSPGFGHTAAPGFREYPRWLSITVMDLLGEWSNVTVPFCIDYNGPSASHPYPPKRSSVCPDSLGIISIVILDTISVRHTTYPDPWEPYFPHCPCYDTSCVDSAGEFLDLPFCGDLCIEWTPIDTTSIRLSINGIEYTLESIGMQWLYDSLLVFNTSEAGLSFSEGETVRVCLEEATDRVQHGFGPNYLGRYRDWTHPDTPVPYCWEFYIGDVGISKSNITLSSFGINSIVPNPFNNIVKVNYFLDSYTSVLLCVYNIMGSKIKTLVHEKKPPGKFEIEWDAQNVSSGVYFVNLKANKKSITKKVLLAK